MGKYQGLFGVPAVWLLSVLILLTGCAGQETVQEPIQEVAPLESPAQAAPATPAPEQAAPPTAAARDTISLWKVTNAENTVYLMGSLHLLKPEDYPLDDRYQGAYDGADTVVFETDLAALETPEFMTSMLVQAVYTDGRMLKTELPDDLYAELAATLSGMNVAMDQLEMLRPWFLSLTLTTLHMLQMGYDPTLGIDQHFYERAKTDDKNLGALETPDYQVGLLASFGELDQEALLRETLQELTQLEGILEDIREAWRSGDLAALDLLNQSMRDFPALYKTLVTDRNRNWADRISSYLLEGEHCLVIVGAAHMPGDEGLLSLLRARGYEVSRY